MGRGEWTPILADALKQQADEVIQAIARELPRFWPEPAGLTPNSGSPAVANGDASLASGMAGAALLYGYLGRAWPQTEWGKEASRLLDAAIEAVGQQTMLPWLYTGFTGVAWASEHLVAAQADPADDPNAAVDEALASFLSHSPWQDEYDLIYGVVGLGAYALERLPRESGLRCLTLVVDRLHECAERRAPGLTWFTPPQRVPPHQRQFWPQGYYNLGVAHGVPGVIGLLAGACQARVADEKARSMLVGSVEWLLSQELHENGRGGFRAFVGEGPRLDLARPAWCYGDLGIAVTLLRAGRAMNSGEWEQKAISLGLQSIERLQQTTAVQDAGLCHGAVGVAHMLNRLFHATAEARFREAAQFWYGRALEMRKPGQGVAGFSRWIGPPFAGESWLPDPGVLTGAAGIGLGLLAATTCVEPAWDRMLLASPLPAASAGQERKS